MTDDKVLICAACAEVAATPGKAGPHKYMLVEGQWAGQYDGVCDTTYRCLECNSRWARQRDKLGCTQTFRLLSESR